MTITQRDITAVILAGGQGRRMGGQDKGLIDLDGKTLIEILIHSLTLQQVAILINANRNQDTYRSYGHPVIGDQMENYQGPLAGFSSAMAMVKTDYILTLPCDGPLLREDFVPRFIDRHNTGKAEICVAHDGERLQPVYALIAVKLHADLERFLQAGDRKIDRWYAQHEYAEVDFSDCKTMFQNINTPADQQRLLQQTQ